MASVAGDSPVRVDSARGWLVIAACAAAMIFSAAGIWAPTVGIFLAPLQRDLGWTQTQVYLGVTVAYLLAQLAAPLAGWFVDRGYVRGLILGALSVQVVAFVSLARMGPNLAIYYALCVLTALATLGVSAIPLLRIVNGWFNERRGLALGVLFAAATCGAVLNPLIAQSIIESLGWRSAYMAFSGLTLIVGLGAATAWIRENDGEPAAQPTVALVRAPRAELVDLSAALSQREFWVIAVWLVLYAYSFAAMSFHLVPLLREYGLSADRAALAQSVLGVGSLCGNLLAGALLDRVHAPRLATVFAIVPMCGIGLLVCFPGAALAYVMAATLGVAAGSETSILTYLLGRYFAGSVLGRVTSIQFIALATGAALGPFVAAILHDRYGNYHLLLLANAGTFAVAASAPLLLRQYRS